MLLKIYSLDIERFFFQVIPTGMFGLKNVDQSHCFSNSNIRNKEILLNRISEILIFPLNNNT